MTTAEVREARRRRREAALALRAEMSPTGPAGDRFRVATWNVNSLKVRVVLASAEQYVSGAQRSSGSSGCALAATSSSMSYTDP